MKISVDTAGCMLGEVIACICENDFTRAQAILDCEDKSANYNWIPQGVDTKKFWKVV